ncbi:organic cation transporter protein-like protein [Leptotrombidium deliense]|uniref:Organic cation transporter protein-like protein n=1 Tax=Leptotrombidium deliense TaxID=299467 RepID=A0A443S579_9ACAR|nr:organic cation transporter protein-like protein [Leptotrombidium deliense]
MNNKEVDDLKQKLETIKSNIQVDKDRTTKPNFLDLWKTPYLRNNTAIMSLNWFITVFVYYGVSFNLQGLGGNHFLTFFIAGLVEIPAIILSMFVLKTFDRTSFLSASQIGMFLAFMCAAIVSIFNLKHKVMIVVVFVMFAKFFSTCAFAINYILSGEMYPTVVRQIGVGTNSAAGRIGSMLSPFMKELNTKFHATASFSVFAMIALVDAILVQFLPETRGKDIPDTIAQVEGKQNDIKMNKISNNKKTSNEKNVT